MAQVDVPTSVQEAFDDGAGLCLPDQVVEEFGIQAKTLTGLPLQPLYPPLVCHVTSGHNAHYHSVVLIKAALYLPEKSERTVGVSHCTLAARPRYIYIYIYG